MSAAMDNSVSWQPPVPAVAQQLRENMTRLNPHDQKTALSLLSAKKPTGPQLSYMQSLVNKVSQQSMLPPTGKQEFLSILQLMENAAIKLKSPKVLFVVGEEHFRLSIAGLTSLSPGSINVTSVGGFANRDWYGRIDKSGYFVPSRKFSDGQIQVVVNALKEFAADPAKIAKAYGKRFGNCCFCGLKLTDKRSVDEGYGPICADKYNLPWGE
jgi:hypothetical protein